jgi:hypothetical protein
MFSGFSQTSLVTAPGLVPAGVLGLTGCPSSGPRLLLRDFCVEPIPPHTEERVLVHRMTDLKAAGQGGIA